MIHDELYHRKGDEWMAGVDACETGVWNNTLGACHRSRGYKSATPQPDEYPVIKIFSIVTLPYQSVIARVLAKFVLTQIVDHVTG
jgi:hypothetical protein